MRKIITIEVENDLRIDMNQKADVMVKAYDSEGGYFTHKTIGIIENDKTQRATKNCVDVIGELKDILLKKASDSGCDAEGDIMIHENHTYYVNIVQGIVQELVKKSYVPIKDPMQLIEYAFKKNFGIRKRDAEIILETMKRADFELCLDQSGNMFRHYLTRTRGDYTEYDFESMLLDTVHYMNTLVPMDDQLRDYVNSITELLNDWHDQNVTQAPAE